MAATNTLKRVSRLGGGEPKAECDEPGHRRYLATPAPANHILLDPRLHDCRRVFFQDIRRDIGIGAYTREADIRQEVIVNLDVFVGCLDSTSSNDDLNDIFDYDAIHGDLIRLLDSRHFALQETLIDAIVGLCFQDRRIRAVRATVAKTSEYDDAAAVGIEVFRFAATVMPNA